VQRDSLNHAVRASLVRLPPPHAAHYGVIPAAPPETGVAIGPVRQKHDAALTALGEAEAYARTLHDNFLVSRVLTRQEAISSSAIEGTQSTLDELLTSEETQDAETTTATRQVRSYAAALETFVRRAERAGPEIFSVDFVRALHRRVMRDDDTYPDPPGQLRRVTVWIGGRDIAYSAFNPPPADRVLDCLSQTMDYMRAEGLQAQQQSLFTRMAVAHAHFEAVHPFRDGNGRVGRLLLPLMMAAEGRTPLYLSPYIEAEKAAYYEALKAAQQRLDWTTMVGFLCDAVVGAVGELMTTRRALERLTEVWRARRDFRSGSSSLRALELLPHFPIITVSRLADRLGVTFRAASIAIEQLEAVGVVRERTGFARNRVFVASEALTVLNRPFGAEPALPRR
jgi:Fic family protein